MTKNNFERCQQMCPGLPSDGVDFESASDWVDFERDRDHNLRSEGTFYIRQQVHGYARCCLSIKFECQVVCGRALCPRSWVHYMNEKWVLRQKPYPNLLKIFVEFSVLFHEFSLSLGHKISYKTFHWVLDNIHIIGYYFLLSLYIRYWYKGAYILICAGNFELVSEEQMQSNG